MTRRTKSDALLLVLPALLLSLACGDDSSKPPPDSGTSDGPPIVQDGQIPSETNPPWEGGTGGDQSPAPSVITGHMNEACISGLYSIDVAPNKEQSTCNNIGTKGIVYLQFTIGDAESKPPPSGRTYVVKHQLAGIYPADGEAIAAYIDPAGSQNVKSGSFTVDPYTASASVFTGSFNVTLDNNQQVNATYLSDFCPFDPGSCD